MGAEKDPRDGFQGPGRAPAPASGPQFPHPSSGVVWGPGSGSQAPLLLDPLPRPPSAATRLESHRHGPPRGSAAPVPLGGPGRAVGPHLGARQQAAEARGGPGGGPRPPPAGPAAAAAPAPLPPPAPPAPPPGRAGPPPPEARDPGSGPRSSPGFPARRAARPPSGLEAGGTRLPGRPGGARAADRTGPRLGARGPRASPGGDACDSGGKRRAGDLGTQAWAFAGLPSRGRFTPITQTGRLRPREVSRTDLLKVLGHWHPESPVLTPRRAPGPQLRRAGLAWPRTFFRLLGAKVRLPPGP